MLIKWADTKDIIVRQHHSQLYAREKLIVWAYLITGADGPPKFSASVLNLGQLALLIWLKKKPPADRHAGGITKLDKTNLCGQLDCSGIRFPAFNIQCFDRWPNLIQTYRHDWQLPVDPQWYTPLGPVDCGSVSEYVPYVFSNLWWHPVMR